MTHEQLNEHERTQLWHEAVFQVDTREIGTSTTEIWIDNECVKNERDELSRVVHQLDAHIEELERKLKKPKRDAITMTTAAPSVNTIAINTSTIWSDVEQLQTERDNLKRVVFQLEARVKQMERMYVKEKKETCTMTNRSTVDSRDVNSNTTTAWIDVERLQYERDHLQHLVGQLNTRMEQTKKKQSSSVTTMTELSASTIERLEKKKKTTHDDVSDIVRQLQANNQRLALDQTESDRKIRTANEWLREWKDRYAK